MKFTLKNKNYYFHKCENKKTSIYELRVLKFLIHVID